MDTNVNPKGTKQESALLTRPELEQMITWETNNLYEYLKELYDQQHEDMADNRSVCLGIILDCQACIAIGLYASIDVSSIITVSNMHPNASMQ